MRHHIAPSASVITIPICACGKPAIGTDLTLGVPVCSDHFVAWLESTRTAVR